MMETGKFKNPFKSRFYGTIFPLEEEWETLKAFQCSSIQIKLFTISTGKLHNRKIAGGSVKMMSFLEVSTEFNFKLCFI